MVDDRGEAAVVADLDEEYEIVAELGRGGSAVVYRARDRALGRDVAIKLVRGRADGLDDELIARLGREARMVAKLQHPQIVSVYAVKRLPDGLALIMQWVPGRTLKQTILEEGPLAPARAEALLRDIASALAYAHAHGVIHRDVKPENIFLDAVSGRALLSDFGIASSREFDSRLTMTGTAIGTPTYMAPEQIDGAPADSRSDVYSLGLVAWEMLTGHRPWEGDSLYNVIYRQKHEALRPIDDVRADVPERLQYLIERALQKRPGARWAGADGLLAQLEGSVLPPDWTQWRIAHRRRQEAREAERVAEREARRQAPRHGHAAAHGAAPASLFATALQTIRFRRPDPLIDESTATADAERQITLDANAAHATHASFDASALPPTSIESGSGHDDQPTWMQDEDDDAAVVSPSRGRRWATLGVAAIAVLALAGTWLALGRPAGMGRSDSASIAALDERAVRELPVGLPVAPPIAPPSAPAPADSAGMVAPPSGGASIDSLAATLAVAPDNDPADNGVPPRRARRALPAPVNAPVNASVNAPAVAAVPVEPSLRATSDPGIIAAGGRHSCVVRDARLSCWGANDDGQLGSGAFEDAAFPGAVRSELRFSQVSSGLSHTCALAREGDVYCWGSDAFGQLGDATRTSRSAPVRVASNLLFTAIRAGRDHSCALTIDGVIACWGSNARGQLGDGTTLTRATPTVAATSLRFIAVTAGWQHSCALTRDGSAICWGDNASGQLGDGTVVSRATPLPVSGSTRFTSIAAGSNQTCAISTFGSLWCWGRDGAGSSPGSPRTEPTRVPTSAAFTSVVAGTVHVCARSTTGDVWCMGRNGYGQLGDGTTSDRSVPVKVIAPAPFTSVSAHGAHTCGVLTNGDTMCWGYNIDGQLGDGTRNNQPRPVRVGTPR